MRPAGTSGGVTPGQVGQRARETLGVSLAALRARRKSRELCAGEGRHHLVAAEHRSDAARVERARAVEWPFEVEVGLVVGREVLPEVSHRPGLAGDGGVVGDHEPALAGRKVLARLKREATRRPDRPDGTALPRRAVRLRGILHDNEPAAARELDESSDVEPRSRACARA